MHEASLIMNGTLIFLAALTGGLVAERLKQSPMVGYILGGLLVGPYASGLVQDVHIIQRFADVGIVLLMFTVGIEFNLKRLSEVRSVSLWGGIIQVSLLVAAGMVGGLALGLPISHAIFLGCVMSISSTMIVLRGLGDLGEQGALHGQIMVGWLIVQDLVVILMVAVAPGLSHVESLALGTVAANGVVALLFVLSMLGLAQKFIPALMEKVADTSNEDVFLLFALSLGLGVALLSEKVGLSLSLGAFLAGMVISESDFAHEVLGKILSLKDAFVIVFFVSVGMLINPRELVQNWEILALLLLITIPVKFVVFYIIAAAFRYHTRVAFYAACGMLQIGEFSFVMARIGVESGMMSQAMQNAIMTTALASILLTPYFMRRAPGWYNCLARVPPFRNWSKTALLAVSVGCESLNNHVIIIGYGRVGNNAGCGLQMLKVPIAVVEYNYAFIRKLLAEGIPCVYGDASNRLVLDQTQPKRARLALVTLPDALQSRWCIAHLKSLNPDLKVIARAHSSWEKDLLYKAGAADVIRPETEAGLQMVRSVINHLQIPPDRVEDYLHRQYYADYQSLMREVLPDNVDVLRVKEFLVREGSAINGMKLRDSQIRDETGCSVVAIRRSSGQVVHNPHSSQMIQTGDRLMIMGTEAQLVDFFQLKMEVYHESDFSVDPSESA